MPAPIYNQGDIYFCDPDPKVEDTYGVEMKGDHVWVIVSISRCHRGKAVVGVPLSKHLNKAGGHLTQIPAYVINYATGEDKLNRVALTDQIRVLDKARLRRKLGTLSTTGLSAVFQGMDALFGRTVITTAVAPAKAAGQSPAQPATSEPPPPAPTAANPKVPPAGTTPGNA